MFEALAETIPLSVFRLDTQGNIAYCNNRMVQHTGYPVEQLLGRLGLHLFHPDDRPSAEERWAEVRNDPKVHTIDFRLLTANGAERWVSVSIAQIRDGQGQVAGFVGASLDVDEQRRTDAAISALLRASENSGPGFFPAFTLELARVLGAHRVSVGELVPGTELRLHTLAMTMEGSLRDNEEYSLAGTPGEAVLNARSTGVVYLTASQCQRFSNTHFLRDTTGIGYMGVRLNNSSGEPIGLLQVLSGEFPTRSALGERLLNLFAARAAAELERWQASLDSREARAQLELHEAALIAAANAIAILDTDGIVRWVNPAFCQLTGYSESEIIGRNLRLLRSEGQPPEFYALVWERVRAGKVWRGELRSRRKDATVYQEEMTLTPVRTRPDGTITHYIAIKQDIGERKELERRMLRNQRLESIGTLAAGIAHDLNNALSPIIMGHSLLQEVLPPDLRPLLETVQSSARRGADMVRQLLTFARGADGQFMPLQVRHLLRDVQKIISSTFPKNIIIRAAYANDLPAIRGDATQLYQVFLNLAVNARDAMAHGGTLTIRLDRFKVDETFAAAAHDARPGLYVRVLIADTGAGIPIEIQERIFEPFFTTKSPDKGTGLGLSTVLGIVRNHGGFLNLESTTGQGSSFSVFLPADLELQVPETDTADEIPLSGDGRLVLLVEDEAAIREVCRTVLEAFGYEVVAARDGTEGLAEVTRLGNRIHLVLTDVQMPYMDGVTFVRTIRHLWPKLAVAVMTGRNEAAAAAELKELGVAAILEKPYNRHQLMDLLRRIQTEETHQFDDLP
jgi:PAS domain S-box-containing protein